MSEKRRGKLVAVIGLDGSGKTTLARGLVEELQAHGYRAVYVHGWPQLFSPRSPRSSVARERGEEEGRGKGAREDFRLPGWRAWGLFFLMLCMFKLRLPRLLRRYEFVICDRFVHDVVTYLRLRGQRRPAAWLLRAGASLKPEAIFWLRVPVEVLAERKGSELEHPPSVYSRWDRLYEEAINVTPWGRCTHRLSGLQAPQEVLSEALGRLGLRAEGGPLTGS